MLQTIKWMVRASLLEANAYEEVEADENANLHALFVVVAAALAMGIGSIENSGLQGIFWHTVVAIVGWYVWAYVTYVIGTRLFPTDATVADHGELLRTIGFSSSPGVLRVLMIFPALSLPVFGICTLWMLVAMVVAVRQALDYTSTLRAIAVCAVGFPIYVIAIVASVLVLGPWPG